MHIYTYTYTYTHTHIYIGEENGNPLQYSCLENLKDRGAWQATVHRVAKSRTQLKQLSISLLLLFDILGKNSYGREK